MTVNGPGGSGKSVVINTVVGIMRTMFGVNDVVKIVAPTGTAAFNVSGETFHHLMGNRVTRKQYTPNSMGANKRLDLIKRFKTLLCLIIDERSLINSKDLGTTERQLSETIYGGGPLSEMSFGGLPILVLFGDDYQLPGTDEGGFGALYMNGGAAMTRLGRSALLECSHHVMELKGSKRMQNDKVDQKALLGRLRLSQDLPDKDVNKLLSLHLDVITEMQSEKYVESIEEKSLYLFYKNEKRIRHNMLRLAKNSGKDNPVAIMKPQSKGPVAGKAIASHFESKPPDACMVCVGSKVAIENRNLCPVWGLHNGACGTVMEIVFAKGTSPINGDLPLYIVVHFPLYCGPIWDTDNPKVSPK